MTHTTQPQSPRDYNQSILSFSTARRRQHQTLTTAIRNRATRDALAEHDKAREKGALHFRTLAEGEEQRQKFLQAGDDDGAKACVDQIIAQELPLLRNALVACVYKTPYSTRLWMQRLEDFFCTGARLAGMQRRRMEGVEGMIANAACWGSKSNFQWAQENLENAIASLGLDLSVEDIQEERRKKRRYSGAHAGTNTRLRLLA